MPAGESTAAITGDLGFGASGSAGCSGNAACCGRRPKPALAKAFGLKLCRVYKLLHEQTLSDGSGVMRSQSEALRLERARRLGRDKG